MVALSKGWLWLFLSISGSDTQLVSSRQWDWSVVVRADITMCRAWFRCTIKVHLLTVFHFEGQFCGTDDLLLMEHTSCQTSETCFCFTVFPPFVFLLFTSGVRRMRLINELRAKLVKYYEEQSEPLLGSSFTTLSLISNITSNGLSVPEEVLKHPWKLSRTMGKDSSILDETNSEFVMVVVLLPFQG